MIDMTLDDELEPLGLLVDSTGERLDKWLTTALPEHSRSVIQRWIANSRVTIAGSVVKASYRVQAGEVVQLDVPPLLPAAMEAQDIPLTIVYEDADLLLVDKPAGLVVHPAPGHASGTLVNALLYHVPDLAGIGGELRPGIVHRLDKDTSGLILVAKNDQAHRALQRQFKERSVHKVYLAPVSYTHLRAHETVLDLVCRLLLAKKPNQEQIGICRLHTLHIIPSQRTKISLHLIRYSTH